MDRPLYYRHSGQFSVTGVLGGALVGLAAGVLAAAAYAYGVLYIPLIYLNLLLCIGYGLIVGLVPSYVMRRLRVRSVPLIWGITLVLALVSFYVAWGVWVHAHMRRGDLHVPLLNVLGHPRALWAMIRLINETGTWGLGRSPDALVNGPLLACVWLVEACVYLFFVVRAVGASLFAPFCEACQLWCKQDKMVGLVAIGDHRELQRRLEAKDFAYLEQVGVPKGDPQAWFQLDLHHCPQCQDTTTLCVSRCRVTTEKKGKKSVNRSLIVRHLLLDAPQTTALKETCARMLVSAVEAATAAPAAPAAEQPDASLPADK